METRGGGNSSKNCKPYLNICLWSKSLKFSECDIPSKISLPLKRTTCSHQRPSRMMLLSAFHLPEGKFFLACRNGLFLYKMFSVSDAQKFHQFKTPFAYLTNSLLSWGSTAWPRKSPSINSEDSIWLLSTFFSVIKHPSFTFILFTSLNHASYI